MDHTAPLDYFTTAQTVVKSMQEVKDLSGQTDTNVELKQVNSFAFCMSQTGKMYKSWFGEKNSNTTSYHLKTICIL